MSWEPAARSCPQAFQERLRIGEQLGSLRDTDPARQSTEPGLLENTTSFRASGSRFRHGLRSPPPPLFMLPVVVLLTRRYDTRRAREELGGATACFVDTLRDTFARPRAAREG